ncbi:TPA: hypothetical protein L5618_000227 [Pseudomonas aeruginosa]|nr:hypothetical protein [Pseudomonas aeruginosa]HBP4588064.1 hypothetical protein [Pseudomonas aeruginosa]HBP4855482.1 hypothetical protein [Pseudomonas aeruginosa]
MQTSFFLFLRASSEDRPYGPWQLAFPWMAGDSHGPCAATAIVRLLLVDDSLMPKLSHAEIVVNEN